MITLDHAVCFDIETLPNCITVAAEMLHSDANSVWEVSAYRDDRAQLIQWFEWLAANQVPMIGFNSEGFDYPVLHVLWKQRDSGYQELYAKSQQIIEGEERFAHTIWPRDRFAPQIDLYKIHHFDNQAKRTSLKALQFNMRSPNVRESEIPFGVPVAQEDIDRELIPYNQSDVTETKRFAHYSLPAIEFRTSLIDQFGIECLSWNDTKIGEKMLEQSIGEDVCYRRVPIIGRDGEPWIDYATGQPKTKREKRQTVRSFIRLNDIIFPYIQFDTPEFQRVLDYMRAQVLTPDDLDDPDATIKTKGVFTDLHAVIGGLTFYFGTGGVHASVEAQRFVATEEWPIRDIDVAGLYPSIAIKNKLAPEHLGAAFVTSYAAIPEERAKHPKGTPLNGLFKLAGNGAYGKSNSKFSVLYDPQFTMQITINGQLMLCMLAEWLLTVPTIRLIQCNTDGITYQIHRDYVDQAKAIEKRWEAHTLLTLEDADYSHMWIRDVNNYIARTTSGKLKQKGAYWHPARGAGYADSISNSSPPAWHKDLSCPIVQMAAVAAMVDGIPPEIFIRCHTDPYDFMLRAKVNRSDTLLLGGVEQQRVTRYYIARDGQDLIKISPPAAGGVLGQFKRANGVTKADYERIMQETGGAWDERVCSKNKSKYTERRTAIQAGWKVAQCNVASDFSFDRLDYSYYIAEATKLII